MVRAPIDGDPPPTSWHRDVAHDPEHPLRLRALSVVYYLTDVDAGTHCFSAVPESVEAKAGLGAERPPCSGDGAHDLLGPAGTAVLFNAGSCHAGRLRRTDRERRTVHIYYGPGSQPPMSNHTPTPRRLVEHEDPEARRLFRRPNDLTRAMLQQA
jgi:ectoine hydroxylase-related dioxygenase (phytanoyl-CoA dioxygenase family)